MAPLLGEKIVAPGISALCAPLEMAPGPLNFPEPPDIQPIQPYIIQLNVTINNRTKKLCVIEAAAES